MWFSIIAAAIAPGISLLCYFYLKDKYESEPISMVARLFIFGVILVFPTMVLQRALVLGFGENPFAFSFLFSAGMEECLKFFIIYYVIYKHVYFDEPYDGIVYAVALSLGFATMENVIYALLDFSTFSHLLFRAFLPVSAHALFGVIMGYQMGKAKFNPLAEKKYLRRALLLPLIFHGIFDYILLSFKSNWLWLMLPLMIFLWLFSLRLLNKANDRSPFRAVQRDEEAKI
ncbi:MAG: prsW [Bacilli bacterium]|jgi:RsiW-degrading membrane proteinase PrsW (M82 family)|nr:prsW [Bacilli bacterium]